MSESDIADLQVLTEKARWRDVAPIVERLARRKLEGTLFPVFSPLLTVKQNAIYKFAITIVGKMRQPPPAAFDAVLVACPQMHQRGV